MIYYSMIVFLINKYRSHEDKLQLFLIVLFIPMIFIINACEECHQIGENLLTDKQKSQIPFDGNEKITFSEGQQIIEFIVSEVSDTLYQEFPSTNYCDWYTVERYSIVFSGVNYDIIFSLRARNDFIIKIKSEYKYDSFMNMDPATGEISSESGQLIDSLTINNSHYFNVYKDTLFDISYPNPAPDSLRHPINLYYSNEYGIVKVDFSDGPPWELEEIVW